MSISVWLASQNILVDEEDRMVAYKYSWHINNDGYVMAWIDGKKELLHRFLLKPKTGQEIDHINGEKTDNRRCNLRIVTRSQNNANRGKQKGCSSKYKGVTFVSKCKYNPWRASISLNGTRKTLHLPTEKEAAEQYNKWAVELFGEHAQLNKLEEKCG